MACDFFVTVTCGFQLLYVFVVMEHRSRRLIHRNVTAHPTAFWTREQLREAKAAELLKVAETARAKLKVPVPLNGVEAVHQDTPIRIIQRRVYIKR